MTFLHLTLVLFLKPLKISIWRKCFLTTWFKHKLYENKKMMTIISSNYWDHVEHLHHCIVYFVQKFAKINNTADNWGTEWRFFPLTRSRHSQLNEKGKVWNLTHETNWVTSVRGRAALDNHTDPSHLPSLTQISNSISEKIGMWKKKEFRKPLPLKWRSSDIITILV